MREITKDMAYPSLDMSHGIKKMQNPTLRRIRESVCGKFEERSHRLFPEGEITNTRRISACPREGGEKGRQPNGEPDQPT